MPLTPVVWILNDVPIEELCSPPHKCQSGLISFPWQIPVAPSRMISKSSCDLSLAAGCRPGPSGSWCLIKDTSLSVGLWLSDGKRGKYFTFCFHSLLSNMLYIYIFLSLYQLLKCFSALSHLAVAQFSPPTVFLLLPISDPAILKFICGSQHCASARF